MASTYTQNQKDAVKKLSIYDYMYKKLSPPVAYGKDFSVHTNTRLGEVTGMKDAGAIVVSYKEGVYSNFANEVYCKDGTKSGLHCIYALQDLKRTLGQGYYDVDKNTDDFAELLAEIAADMGISQDPTKTNQLKERKEYVKPKNMLERYTDALSAAIAKETGAEVPTKATVGPNGYSPDAAIIQYMASRGIDSGLTKNLINAGVLYLSPVTGKDGNPIPYYEMEKDSRGNLLKDKDGKPQFKLDKNGEKIPQTYIGNDGKAHPKLQYNLVFASKDKSKENAFYERKPMGQRGKAFIAPNSSSFGYFSFTGGKAGFEQVDIPEKTNQAMKAYICEAPIDAISLYALHQKMGVTEPAEYISISGVGKDMAVQRAICEGYDCVLAFDNDEKGLMAMDARRSNAFIDPVISKECSLPAIVPSKIEFDYARFKNAPMQHVESKDWNDILLAATKGQNCTMMVKGEKTAIDPIQVMKDKYQANPRPMLMWREPKAGLKKTGAYPIEPRKFPKSFEPPKLEDKEKMVGKEKVKDKEEVMAH